MFTILLNITNISASKIVKEDTTSEIVKPEDITQEQGVLYGNHHIKQALDHVREVEEDKLGFTQKQFIENPSQTRAIIYEMEKEAETGKKVLEKEREKSLPNKLIRFFTCGKKGIPKPKKIKIPYYK